MVSASFAGGGIAMGSDGLGGFPSSLHLVELVKVRGDQLPDTLALNGVFPSRLSAPEAVRYRHLQHAEEALRATLLKEREEGATVLAISEREAC
jgi:hypothetical protein